MIEIMVSDVKIWIFWMLIPFISCQTGKLHVLTNK